MLGSHSRSICKSWDMLQGENASDGVGGRLRRLLALRGETIKALSDRTGIPYRTLHNHVGGSAKPNADQLALLVEAGIDANFLLTGRLTSETSLLKIVLSEDEKFSLIADSEILQAIDRRAVGIVDAILAAELHHAELITFDKVIDLYKLSVQRLAILFKGSELLISDARRKGVSLDALIGPMLDVATGVFVKELANVTANPVARTSELSSPDAAQPASKKAKSASRPE